MGNNGRTRSTVLRRSTSPVTLPAKGRFLVLWMALFLLTVTSLNANPFFGPGQSSPEPASSDREESEGASLPSTPQLLSPAPSLPLAVPASGSLFLGTQGELRKKLGDLFASFAEDPSPSRIELLLGIAFLYGIFHSLGPGHRKGIIFSFYVARKAPPWEPAAMGVLLALLHGGTSIVILVLLKEASGALSGAASNLTFYIESITYGLVILLVLWLLVHSLREALTGDHSHGTGAMGLGALIVSSLYPCPGTLLILVLSLTLGQLFLGVLTVTSMSLGMSIPVIGFAYLGWLSRKGILSRWNRREASLEKVSAWIQVGGYAILLAVTLYLAYPYFWAWVITFTQA